MQNNRTQRRIFFDTLAPDRDRWKRKNRYYHRDITKLFSFLIPEGSSVLEVGCGTGDLLASLNPQRGVGIDFSSKMAEEAKRKYPTDRYPHLEYRIDDVESLAIQEPFDYVILSDVIGELFDVWTALRNLQNVTHDSSQIIVSYHNTFWEFALRLAELLHLKTPQQYQTWLGLADIENLLNLNGFEVITKGHRLLFPKYIPLFSHVVNRYVAKMPLLKHLCLTVYLVGRPRRELLAGSKPKSVSVIIPCRNEKGNIRNAVEKVPTMGKRTELLFVDGNSNDGTVEEIEGLIAQYEGVKDIRLLHQVEPGADDGKGHGKMLALGKGDAVRKGFAAAEGEILMILDADLTVPPEDLPKFYQALSENHGRFINGTRLVYPMEDKAMRLLNIFANKLSGLLFSWLLGQRVKDTLCGTKALAKEDYVKIAAERGFFGDFDPFGDFDLLFGAAKQNLKIVEVPIRYRQRTYGDIKIERFKHGLLLLKMSFIAMRKLKFW